MDGIQNALSKKDWQPRSIEGETASQWILMDYGDLIVHIFKDSVRKFYDLDKLWADAPRVPVRGIRQTAPRRPTRAAAKGKV